VSSSGHKPPRELGNLPSYTRTWLYTWERREFSRVGSALEDPSPSKPVVVS